MTSYSTREMVAPDILFHLTDPRLSHDKEQVRAWILTWVMGG
jgi:hypothetical protein